METAAVVLGLAALGGATLAIIRLRGTPRPPTALAVLHGLIAVTGLGLLLYESATTGIPGRAQIALVIFVLAALGGATMFLGFHLRGRALPVALVLIHGLAAITGYVLLLSTLL